MIFLDMGLNMRPQASGGVQVQHCVHCGHGPVNCPHYLKEDLHCPYCNSKAVNVFISGEQPFVDTIDCRNCHSRWVNTVARGDRWGD